MPGSIVLQVRVAPQTHAELHTLAESHDLSVAQALRRLVATALRDGKISELA